jgi:hypothetical protein
METSYYFPVNYTANPFELFRIQVDVNLNSRTLVQWRWKYVGPPGGTGSLSLATTAQNRFEGTGNPGNYLVECWVFICDDNCYAHMYKYEINLTILSPDAIRDLG